ncbi:MAG: DUF5686 and carboxypeptidase regulatory-like domain-containing protein [Tannerellaceae bacterium]|jgi:hypothetical protein|nr:DUF5686 and carboxypeptidase regulatory-like domain-containing protein [Tannerellaceae bacterium]
MKIILYIMALAALAPIARAQSLSGLIVEAGGNERVANATVFIRELSKGIAADDRGEFLTQIPAGAYTLEAGALGFEPAIVAVVVKPSGITSTTVSLKPRTYSLAEVTVAGGEDPAYATMRKAIAKAPYLLRLTKATELEAYVKESWKVNRIPKLIGKMKMEETGKKIGDYAGKLFVVEAKDIVKFAAPDSFNVRRIALASSLPDELRIDNAMIVATYNIYSRRIDDWVSPLAPDAFTYYRYRFEGIFQEGDLWINRIKVTPKMKNGELAEGWLHVVEGLWSIAYFDLEGRRYGVQRRIRASFAQARPNVLLPAAYDVSTNVAIMGVELTGRHYSSVRYTSVTLNDSAPADTSAGAIAAGPLGSAPSSPKKEKALRKLEELSSKEKITNRDAYLMARLAEDLAEPDTAAAGAGYEIKETRRNLKVTTDSAAWQKDSAYWASVRDLPLRGEEQLSYKSAGTKTSPSGSSMQTVSVSSGGGGPWGSLLFGKRIRLGWKAGLKFNGLLGIVPEYNFVDGFLVGNKLRLDLTCGKHLNSLIIEPSAYYSTARRAVNWDVALTVPYAPGLNGSFTAKGGSVTADMNSETGNSRLINSVASLLFARNYMVFYHKRFVEIENRIDIANGLSLTLNARNEERRPAAGNTKFSLFGGEPLLNLPSMQMNPDPPHRSTAVAVKLEYTPAYYYRMDRNGQKRYLRSAFPTFSVRYEKGIALGGGLSSRFDRLEAGLRQDIRLNMFDGFRYMINAGTFLSSSDIYFADYKHFPVSRLPVTARDFSETFSLLSDYTNSTVGPWLQAHAAYTSAYLILKRLPFLQEYLFNEALHVRGLFTDERHYLELGYSVGLASLGRAGVFAGSNTFRYLAVGGSLSIPLFK